MYPHHGSILIRSQHYCIPIINSMFYQYMLMEQIVYIFKSNHVSMQDKQSSVYQTIILK